MYKIRTAILGFGLSGNKLIAPFLHQSNKFEISKIYTRNPVNNKSIYSSYSFTNEYNDILNDKSTNLVIVTTPNTSHFELTKRAIEAGKNVVIEKPVTPSSVEAYKLKQLAEKHGIKLAVYHNRRWDSCYKTVKKVIDSSELGEIKEFEASWERYDPDFKENWWRDEPIPGGGVLYDLGPHLIDQALALFGMPQAVFADLRKMRPGGMVDDYFDLNLYYPDKKVRLKSGVYNKQSIARYIVHGTKGSFVKKNIDPQGSMLCSGILPETNDYLFDNEECIISTYKKDFIKAEKATWMEYYDILYDYLTDKGTAPPVSIDDGIKTIEIIEKALLSNKEKKIKSFLADNK
jgi:predicted dehydrogenase